MTKLFLAKMPFSQTSPDLGTQLFTHILYNEYGPPPGFCWDLPCDDPPLMEGEGGNMGQRMELLVDWVREQAGHYRWQHGGARGILTLSYGG